MAVAAAAAVAARRRVLSMNRLLLPIRHYKYYTTDSSSSSSSYNNSLLLNLLKIPNSKIKSALDSDGAFVTLNDSEFDSLVTGLTSSSAHKAGLVLEWRLDWMLNENDTDYAHYTNLISLCAKIQNVSLAMHIFTRMEAGGIKPNTCLFNSLIHACLSSTTHVLTSLSLFEVMENSEFYKPNSQTYDTFILGFSNLRDLDKVLAWFTAKKAAGFPAVLQNYEYLICTCVRARDFNKADKFFDEMLSVGVMPSLAVLEWVLRGLCKRRNCNRVGEFLSFLLESRFQVTGNMIDEIVELYSELGKVDEMEKLLETLMEFNQVDEALLRLHCGIIRYYAKMDRLDDVEYSVGRMMSRGMLFRSSNDVEKVISSYFRNEAYDRLDLVLEHVKGYQKLSRSTYDLLVAGYRRAGLAEKLDLVIQDMKLAGLI